MQSIPATESVSDMTQLMCISEYDAVLVRVVNESFRSIGVKVRIETRIPVIHLV